MNFRCGDHVHHGPTGENWVVAYVDGEYLAWCGWPAGEAKLADCTLVKACDDVEHLRMLEQCAASSGKRQRKAQEALVVLLAETRATPSPESRVVKISNPG
jgi:hypothetical protein